MDKTKTTEESIQRIYFSDFFDVSPVTIENYGAFNVSLLTDLPLFIDPFLLFNSKEPTYQKLHSQIVQYIVFLRDKASAGHKNEGLLRAWYCFPEVKQTWLGFSKAGNSGSGLGLDFAKALHSGLASMLADFGEEEITEGSHLEKVCLVKDGIGRDNISDFTTNLIKGFLCEYTQGFAQKHLSEDMCKRITVQSTGFNYETETWVSKPYVLPFVNGDYILLVPKDILTRDETWINREDLIRNFAQIPTSIPDQQLRAQVENYFHQILFRNKRKPPTQKDRALAAINVIHKFPELIDWYIRYKELHGYEAKKSSASKVSVSEMLFIKQVRDFQGILEKTNFYASSNDTYEEAHRRVDYLKDVIENKGGHRLFFVDGAPVQREADLQIMFRLVWFGTDKDVSSEVNDGRGPADFKISFGAKDKTIVEMKLAKNTQLERNLKNQAELYQKASDAKKALKVILFFSESEWNRVGHILRKLGLTNCRDVVLIDARNDNKPSGSKA